MFRFKENSRLMPCMEQAGPTAFTMVFPSENTQKEKITLHEGTRLIVKYEELQEEIDGLKEKIFILENQKSEILDKINNDPILMSVLKDVISEVEEKDRVRKTK